MPKQVSDLSVLSTRYSVLSTWYGVTTMIPSAIEPQPLLAAWSLGKREIVRFFRQRNRIVGAVGTPVLFWLLFGAGFSSRSV